MHKNGYAIEKILKRKLCKEDYANLLFWSGSICHLAGEKPEFKHLIIGQEWLYTMNHPKRHLESRIHFSSILGVVCIGDLAKFLTCQITRNYNHICIEFIDNVTQKCRHVVDCVDSVGQNLKASGEQTEDKKLTDMNNLKSNKTENSVMSDILNRWYDDQVINFTRKLHIYLNDTDFIGFEILQKAVRSWHQSNKGFKYMIRNLIHLQDFQSMLQMKNQISVSSSSLSPSPLPPTIKGVSTENIETLVANVTRRNTIVYSTTALNADLQQLMSMFKPFTYDDIISSVKIVNNHLNTTSVDIISHYLNQFDDWIKRAKEINKLLLYRGESSWKFNALVDENLSQLVSVLSPLYRTYPVCFPVKFSDKVITVIECLVTQLTHMLSEQPTSFEDTGTQLNDELKDNVKYASQLPLKQMFNDQLKLVIRLLTNINSLLSSILPICIHPNETSYRMTKNEISLSVSEIIMRKKLRKTILHLIEHLAKVPLAINEFTISENDTRNTSKHNCYKIELEVWIRAFEMKRLDSLSNPFQYFNNRLNVVLDDNTIEIVTKIRNILNKDNEIGAFIHQLNYQINCLLCELISHTSSVSMTFSTTIDKLINSELFHEDWIRDIIHKLIINSSESIVYLLDCLMAHACTRWRMIYSKLFNCHLSPPPPSPLSTVNNIKELDEKESISTIIRSLFIIDWLTEQYPHLIQPLKAIGCNDLFYFFNSKHIVTLMTKLSEKYTVNFAQIKLIKCVLAALVSRLYNKLGRKKGGWINNSISDVMVNF
ncbi:unnamed protein product [Heterobilharzia americana]|nr:unnamed protein product [Heterobilharzia americana]